MMSKPVTIPIEMLIDAVLKELSAAPINWLAGEIANLEQLEKERKQRRRNRYRTEARRQRQ